jgi:hypothetical protein
MYNKTDPDDFSYEDPGSRRYEIHVILVLNQALWLRKLDNKNLTCLNVTLFAYHQGTKTFMTVEF